MSYRGFDKGTSSARLIELISEIQFNKERDIISIQEICKIRNLI